MKILFLDDDEERHSLFKKHIIEQYDAAYTVSQAIEFLKNNNYDIVFLDHDLGGKQMVSSYSEEETGYLVSKWIEENNPNIKFIIVHSYNHQGSLNIMSRLKSYNHEKILFCDLKTNKNRIFQKLKDLENE